MRSHYLPVHIHFLELKITLQHQPQAELNHWELRNVSNKQMNTIGFLEEIFKIIFILGCAGS